MVTQTPIQQQTGTGQRLDYAAAEGLTEIQQRGLAEENWRTWMIFAAAGTALLALIAVIFGVVAIAQSERAGHAGREHPVRQWSRNRCGDGPCADARRRTRDAV
jgi:hypothetical protein